VLEEAAPVPILCNRAASYELTVLAEELDVLFEKGGKVEITLFSLLREDVGLDGSVAYR
jgi:hypothetical protein